MRTFSAEGKRNLLATSADDPLIVLAEITHVDLAAPIRVANNIEPIVSLGNTFVACPFQLTLPDDIEGQVPKATISVDNVGQELTEWLEFSRGGQNARCRLMMVQGKMPNILEFDLTLDMSGLKIDNEKVTAQLGFVNILGRPAVALNFTPQTAPGLY